MSRFSSVTRQCCLATMDSLMAHPIAAQFYELEDVSAVPKEFDLKKQSTGLKQARDKLASNKYNTISQWEKDVRQIFTIFEKVNSNNEFFAILAVEMERLFRKHEEQHLRNKIPKWTNAVVKFDKKLDEVFDIPPPIVIAHTPISKKDGSNEKPFSEDEMNSFVKFSKYLTSEEDNRAIISIIRGHQPDFKFDPKNAVIDVSDLTHETMLALRKFFSERLARMNMQYPH